MNVAIFGRFAVGKTTLARELEDEFGYSRVSMAANMKNIVKEVYGTIDKSDTIMARQENGSVREMNIREVLQQFGQNAKDHDRDFWLRWFLNDTSFMGGIPLVMDDARLQFEADALRNRDWLLVRLEAPVKVRRARYLAAYGRYPTPAESAHQTETESDTIKVDLVLDGSESPETLAEKVMAYIADEVPSL